MDSRKDCRRQVFSIDPRQASVASPILATSARSVRRNKGVTLIEALVAIGLLALLVTVGIPSFSAARENALVRSVAGDLQQDLHTARWEAVRTGMRVRLQRRQDAWSRGWSIVVRQATDDGELIETVMSSRDLAGAGADVSLEDGRAEVAFDGRGALLDSATGLLFRVAPAGVDSKAVRGVSVALSGQIEVRKLDAVLDCGGSCL